MTSAYDIQLVKEHLAQLKQPSVTSPQETQELTAQLTQLLKQEDAVIVAHYYTSPEIQALAEATGGFVGDSLEMARFGANHAAKTLIVAGVKFMGETAKILSPAKRILMPTLEATCSLDLGCDADELAALHAKHPEHQLVVYANTSAAVKAQADWVVTSSIAVNLISHLHSLGQKILWAPDKHLGDYINRTTGANMLLWDSACIVHEEFKAKGIEDLKKLHPEAAVLVHPESPESVTAIADVVGSTSQLLKATQELPNKKFIVATDKGIFYKMQQANPNKIFLEAPTAGQGANCRSCANCPWMAMNNLELMHKSLTTGSNEILVDADLIAKALVPLEKMLNFKP